MKILDLISGIDAIAVLGDVETEINGICCDSRKVVKGDLYVAISGLNHDGHNFVDEAIKNGAAAVLTEHGLMADVPQVVVWNTRQVLGQVASNFFGNPSKSLKVLGITGTNGKTSTTYIVKHILEFAGKKVGMIGTNGIYVNGTMHSQNFTTPDPIELHKAFFDMKQAGVEVCVMEVSAHALDLGKMNGTMCDVAAFTNLTQDHLDYFVTMECYGAAKRKFFSSELAIRGIVCLDDRYSQKILENADIPILTFGFSEKADVYIHDLKPCEKGQEFILNFNLNGNNESLPVTLSLHGRFNVLNAVLGLCAANSVLEDVNLCVDALKTVGAVPGRFNVIDLKSRGIAIVDYAHTPDGLENILSAAKEISQKQGGRLISLFGCGGNRDAKKRPIMGQISEKYADFSVVTSDNPRFENPEAIIADILDGMKNSENYVAITNRKEAIAYSVKNMTRNDVLVVAGKGAENYLDIQGVKFEYSDYEAIESVMPKR